MQIKQHLYRSHRRWVRRSFTLSAFILMSLVTLAPPSSNKIDLKDQVTLSDKARSFLAELKACQEAQAANPGKCGLFGKIKIVKSFPDVKVQVVDSFPDLKVQVVKSFANSPGKWQFVDSFPDYKIQYVSSFADVKVKFVDSFPGCN